VFGDGGRAGVVALFVKGFPQPYDLVFELGTDGAGIVVGRRECGSNAAAPSVS